jgi:type II secretory ATPase GspE/PulE/Tfp pilus assembly ATPase PilB-like protein
MNPSPAGRADSVRAPVTSGFALRVAPESAEQVVLAGRGTVEVEAALLKGLDLQATVPVFLPRGARLELVRGASSVAFASVRKVAMVRLDPAYLLTLRLEQAPSEELRARCSAEAPERAAPKTPPRPPAGALPSWTRHLLAAQALTPAELDEQFARSRRSGQPLEQVLREVGVAFEAVERCRALDLGLCYVDLAEHQIRLANAALVGPELARRHGLFPLFVLDGALTLGMVDPTELAVIDQVRLRVGRPVDATLCPRAVLEPLIARAFGAKESAAATVRREPEGDGAGNVIAWVDALVREAAEAGASDVHIEPERDEVRVRIRVDGILHKKSSLPAGQQAAIASRLKVLARLDIAETRRPQDGQFSLNTERGTIDVRVSSLPTVWGENVVLRLLLSDGVPLGLAELGMPASARAALEAELAEPHGMLLVTGPTGSGKTTTLYAALARLNTMERNVVTVEDPVERRLPLLRQTQVNPAAGVTFASGLRGILRQDPDVIMVGEIRDRETAEVATQAALTGHLVLSTLHTNTAAGALVRLCEIGIPAFLVTSSLKAVISQRLVRRVCRACAREVEPDGRLARALGLGEPSPPLRAGSGCRACLNTGYKGRIGIYEMLRVTSALAAAVLGGVPREALEGEARRALVCTLREDGVRQVRAGETTLEELVRVIGLDPAHGAGGSA